MLFINTVSGDDTQHQENALPKSIEIVIPNNMIQLASKIQSCLGQLPDLMMLRHPNESTQQKSCLVT